MLKAPGSGMRIYKNSRHASAVEAWFITFRSTRKTNNQWQCASVGAWFITFRNIQWTNSSRNGLSAEAERDKSCPYGWCHCPVYENPSSKGNLSQIYIMNKFNKTAVLTTNTADIRQHIILHWQKTLVFGITRKALIISVIYVFNAGKNKNKFQ